MPPCITVQQGLSAHSVLSGPLRAESRLLCSWLSELKAITGDLHEQNQKQVWPVIASLNASLTRPEPVNASRIEGQKDPEIHLTTNMEK